MTLYKKRYRIESTRMPYWDYTKTSLYFITICTHNKEHSLGKITDKEFHASPAGEIADECWYEIPQHFPFVTLDKFQVMPNHIHGIIHISANHNPMDPGRDAHMRVSTMDEGKPDPNAGRSFGPLQKNSLSMVINNYKAAVKWRCRDQHIPFAWQGNFHDNIIRSDKEYHRIRWYVENNAANWEGDSLNPEATTTIEFPEDLR